MVERYTGEVCFAPIGPHFYLSFDGARDEHPPGAADVLTNHMFDRLTELNAAHGWPITTEHVKAHTPIIEVSWNDDTYNREWEFEDFDVNFDWYSQEKLWEWDDL